jgi:hypothetical protein
LIVLVVLVHGKQEGSSAAEQCPLFCVAGKPIRSALFITKKHLELKHSHSKA